MSRYAWKNWICLHCGHEWNGPWDESGTVMGYLGFPPICPNVTTELDYLGGGHAPSRFNLVRLKVRPGYTKRGDI